MTTLKEVEKALKEVLLFKPKTGLNTRIKSVLRLEKNQRWLLEERD